MRHVGTLLGVALALTAVYLAYETARESPDVQALARQTACGPGSGCVVEGVDPARVDRNAFRHEYEWKTSLGPAQVECRRAQVWLGPWSCTVERARVGNAGGEVGAYPDAPGRGEI